MSAISAVLFDLDGTLLDTAPDLVLATNRVLIEEGRPALPFERLRPHVSAGAPALLRLAFGQNLDGEAMAPRLQRLLDCYRDNLAVHTRLFEGMADVLEHIEREGLPWGVVTNKPGWLTEPLMETLELAQRAGCIVSGDSTAEQKPHPLPMLEAARRIRTNPACCIYVGDDARDIQAGRAAGMKTLAASYGYIKSCDDPGAWGADGMIETPLDLLHWLRQRDTRREAMV